MRRSCLPGAALLLAAMTLPFIAAGEETAPEIRTFDIAHTVLKVALAPGVSGDDAAAAMQSKAVELNLKLAGHQNVGLEVSSRGVDSPRLEIFQFCNPEDAVRMVRHDTIFAAYMPCSIALVEDHQGQLWLQMLNLDLLIGATSLPPDLQALALQINGMMLEIIAAGSTGEF